MSKWVRKIPRAHQCRHPSASRRRHVGSVWLCRCGKYWEIKGVIADTVTWGRVFPDVAGIKR